MIQSQQRKSVSYKLARRSFLAGIGASSLLVPLLKGIESHAQTGTGPVRFLVIHHPVGTVRNQWLPTASGASFTLPRISAAFEPLRSQMTIIDGVDLVASNSGSGTHEGGMVALMTGQPTFGEVIGEQDHVAGGPSIDQILLNGSPLLGNTAFGSLELAADNRADRDEISPRVMSYNAPIRVGERLPRFPSIRPIEVYNRIFGNFIAASPEDAARLLAEKRSVLDFMVQDLERLRSLVPSTETSKLDAHAEAIRKLETGLTQGAVAVGGGCQQPAVPGTYPDNPNQFYPAQPGYHPHGEIGQHQLSLIRTAFACDLARVATFMWSPGTNHVVFGGLPGFTEAVEHHGESHDTSSSALGLMTEIARWYAEQTSAALQLFASTQDALGTGSLLDNTVVVYTSEISRGYDHDFENVPLIVFGGPGVKLSGNRFLKVGPERPMNDVWLALAQNVFNANLPTLGAKEQYTGALPGLVG